MKYDQIVSSTLVGIALCCYTSNRQALHSPPE